MSRTRFARFALVLITALAAVSFPASAVAQARDSVPIPTVRAVDTAHAAPASRPNTLPTAVLTMLGGLALMGALKTVSSDRDSAPATKGDFIQAMNAVRDIYYFFLNDPRWQVAAAAVAPPVCARGTTASKVKTTATTQLRLNGVLKSLTATDDLWTLNGSTLAAGSVRRYLLLWDGTSATTVVSVLASDDRVIASYGSAALALAACRFPSLPAGGTGIVGILSIANTTNPFIPATTLLSATGVTDTYIDGYDDSVFRSAVVLP